MNWFHQGVVVCQCSARSLCPLTFDRDDLFLTEIILSSEQGLVFCIEFWHIFFFPRDWWFANALLGIFVPSQTPALRALLSKVVRPDEVRVFSCANDLLLVAGWSGFCFPECGHDIGTALLAGNLQSLVFLTFMTLNLYQTFISPPFSLHYWHWTSIKPLSNPFPYILDDKRLILIFRHSPWSIWQRHKFFQKQCIWWIFPCLVDWLTIW